MAHVFKQLGRDGLELQIGGSLLMNKAFLEVKLEPFFVLVSKGCFVIKRAKSFPAPPPSYKC